ncbi:tetratricopeptide repeat protein [Lacibacterium aquatile]|uniref:Tetratricopeptide repeat protein n=1 Tax=Lacibacterium aquatile TaxID=1168082 RepID=A0ABW5DRV0_9PROT
MGAFVLAKTARLALVGVALTLGGCVTLDGLTGGSSERALTEAAQLRRSGKPDQAITVARNGLAERPGDAALKGELGKSLVLAGKAGEAMPYLEAAVQATPNDWRLLTAMGSAFDQQGAVQIAESWHRRADAAGPNNPVVLNNWGLSLAQAGRSAEARALLARAVTLPQAPVQAANNLKLLDEAAHRVSPGSSSLLPVQE